MYDSIRADPAYKKTDKKQYEKPGKIQGKARSPPRSKSLYHHHYPIEALVFDLLVKSPAIVDATEGGASRAWGAWIMVLVTVQ